MIKNKDFWLLSKPIAHRGLWGNDIVENSITAYNNAISHGYPIEIDVYLSSDDVLMCFHDQSLERMTGEKDFIYNKTFSQLKQLKLNNTKETIPALDEVLQITENKVPLLIEIKDQPNKLVVDKLIERLKNYKGEFAIQSFNPFYLNKVRKLAPNFIRGILATEYAEEKNWFTRFVLKHMSFNFLCKPQFISYRHSGLPLSKRKTKNTPVIAWTITSKELENKIKPYVNNIIFENYIP